MKKLFSAVCQRFPMLAALTVTTIAFCPVETRADEMVVHQETYSMGWQSEFLGNFYSEHYDDGITTPSPNLVYGNSNLWVYLEITVRDEEDNKLAEGGMVIQHSGGEIDISESEDDGLSFDPIPTESGQNLSELTVGISYLPPVWLETGYKIEVKLWKSWDFYEPDTTQSDTQEVDWIP